MSIVSSYSIRNCDLFNFDVPNKQLWYLVENVLSSYDNHEKVHY